MAKAATNADLKAGFAGHLEQTKMHVERLDQIGKQFGKNLGGHKCKGRKVSVVSLERFIRHERFRCGDAPNSNGHFEQKPLTTQSAARRGAARDPLSLGQGPNTKRWEQRDKQQKLNQLVKDIIARGSNMAFIDMWEPFLGADGKPNDALFVEDKLHHNAEGYRIRTRIVKPFLQEK
jgi:lysophospholipase L1-like esterase